MVQVESGRAAVKVLALGLLLVPMSLTCVKTAATPGIYYVGVLIVMQDNNCAWAACTSKFA